MNTVERDPIVELRRECIWNEDVRKNRSRPMKAWLGVREVLNSFSSFEIALSDLVENPDPNGEPMLKAKQMLARLERGRS